MRYLRINVTQWGGCWSELTKVIKPQSCLLTWLILSKSIWLLRSIESETVKWFLNIVLTVASRLIQKSVSDMDLNTLDFFWLNLGNKIYKITYDMKKYLEIMTIRENLKTNSLYFLVIEIKTCRTWQFHKIKLSFKLYLLKPEKVRMIYGSPQSFI